MCDFASTSNLVALPIYSFHCVRDKSFYYQVCVWGGGGRGRGEGRRERGGGGRILFRCSTRGEVGVGWSLIFFGILGWEGEGEGGITERNN